MVGMIILCKIGAHPQRRPAGETTSRACLFLQSCSKDATSGTCAFYSNVVASVHLRVAIQYVCIVLLLSTLFSIPQVTADVVGNVEAIFNYRYNYDSSKMVATKLAAKCVYYIPSISGANENGRWSTDGCTTHVINSTHTRCVCSHLTSFAVVVSSDDHSPADTRRLSIITDVGIGVSLVGIVVTIATLLNINVFSKALRYKVGQFL
jgi:hypothetical protein